MATNSGTLKYLCQIFNQDDERNPSHQASQAFVDLMLEKIRDGRGFLPFIGAGFSVTAGIPIIQQLLNYLQRCICVALGAEKEYTAVWNPRTDQWPPFVDRYRTQPNDHWIRLMRARLDLEVEREEENRIQKRKPNTWTALYQEALGAMAEWRTALHFLSRLVLVQQADGTLNRKRPSLGVPDQDVVDACWREVMRHKRPTLNHRMLAAVSGILRVDLILTTNFDGLIEEAFEESRDPLEVFDVHMKDALPSLSAVSRQRSIVKMHGSQRSLRADYSLDGLPRQEDIATLFDYIAGQKLTDDIQDPEVKNHLLIAGVGGTERRTFEFIRRSLDRFGASKLEVFWIAYNKDEIAKIKEFFSGDPGSKERDKASQIHILRHADAGLLFLHLYQWFRKSLPSNGSVFPSITRLSFPPLMWQGHKTIKDPQRDSQIRTLQDDLEKKLTQPDTSPERIFFVPAKRDVYGVCTAAARLYRKLEQNNMCLWIDMNDIYSADNLFEAFQEAASYRLGETDWTPLYVQKDEGSLFVQEGDELLGKRARLWREIERIIRSSNRPWILFLDAREMPGSNHDEIKNPNGWMDEPLTENNASEAKNREALIHLLMQFANANPKQKQASAVEPGKDIWTPDEDDKRTLRVVLLCNQDAGEDVFVKHLDDTPSAQYGPLTWQEQFSPFKWDNVTVEDLPTANTIQQVVEDVIRWTDKNKKQVQDRRQFLQALVSMQRPRHLAVVWARCAHPEWALVGKTDSERGKWLDELGRQGLLRRMDGGFIWFQAKYREGLRKCLRLRKVDLKKLVRLPRAEPFELSEDVRDILSRWNATANQAEVHLGLTTWYRKVFDATEVAPAILEMIDHLCESARCLVIYPHSKPKYGQDLNELAASRVAAARELLGEHQFLIQSQGHPRATLRRLLYFQDFWLLEEKFPLDFWPNRNNSDPLKQQVIKFQSTIEEACRVIFREIGEDGEAYDRQRDVAVYMTTKNEVLTHAQVEARSRAWYELGKTGISISTRVTKQVTTRTGRMRRRNDWRIRELVRWWRWCGMLALWTRSHEEASKSLGRALYVARTWHEPQRIPAFTSPDLPPDDPDLQSLEREPGFLADWVLDPLDGHKFHLEVLHSLELAAYCLLLRAHTMSRYLILQSPLPSLAEKKKGLPSAADGPAKIRSLLETAGRFARQGLQFVEQVQNNGKPSEDHDLDLLWCKSRLLMMAGLASQYLPRPKDGRHAMSMLTDAAACLKRTSPERGHSDLAIVEMRRAEVRLHEAAHQIIDLNPAGHTDPDPLPQPFEEWTYDRLRSTPASARKAIKAMQIAVGDGPKRNEETKKSLRTVRARTMDALRYLDRAEPILRERRRNVWWTSWYFERRLRAMSMLLWVAAIDTSSVIPFVGLEAAMEGTDTELDLLLEDAKRMVRADSYRLAMILLSYASCARALQIRLDPASTDEAMNRRLRTMQEKIKDALAYLDKVHLFRNKSELGKRSVMDNLADEVVKKSIERIASVLKGLEPTSAGGAATIDPV